MNATSAAVATAATFVWLGMVLAISFLEAPLKFRAPDVLCDVDREHDEGRRAAGVGREQLDLDAVPLG